MSNFFITRLKIWFSFIKEDETVSFLKKLGTNNIKYFDNLKYSQSEYEKIEIDNHLIKIEYFGFT